MTKPVRYLLYRVTRTEETFPSRTPIHLGLPDLNVTKNPRLKEVHPFFEEELWFEIGQTRTVPLTETQARRQEQQGWKIERRGHGEPVNDSERALISFCETRAFQFQSARDRVLSFTNPYGDYVRAGLVAAYLKTAQLGDELEGLRESGLISDDVAETMAAVVDRLVELRTDLEGKGWQFDSKGTVFEPSSGGRPAAFPNAAIRAHYRQLALQHSGQLTPNATDQNIVRRIQSDLQPFFGKLTDEEVRAAIRYEVKRQARPPADVTGGLP